MIPNGAIDTMSDTIRLNRVTLSLILFLLAQAVLGIVWGARLDANVASMAAQITKLEKSISDGMMLRYTSTDATKDKELMLKVLDAIHLRINLNEQRIQRLEDKPRP